MPLRSEAKAAMIEAMDVVGNPSSVHAEGRKAKALLERARAEIAELLGAMDCDIVFTSGATEAADLALSGRGLVGAAVEHDAVLSCVDPSLCVNDKGSVSVIEPSNSTLQLANSETGVIQDLPDGLAVSDLTQAIGKIPVAFSWTGAQMGLISAHKFGGPKGVGAVILRRGLDLKAKIGGGGQEMGRRSGTENLIGIAGLAAALKAANDDLNRGVWQEIEEFRNILEISLHTTANKTIFVGKGADRLPNTSCIVTPGWKGETQVMQMDLAGFAISAGSACSSGKVRASKVLGAMGFDEQAASSAIRVSLGPETTRESIDRFADTWLKHYEKFSARAA